MNTPNPLIPQGSLPNTRGKNQIRIAVITILAIHVVLLLALLMAGCKKTSEQAKNESTTDPSGFQPPPFDPNSLPVGTNPPPTPPASNAIAITPVPTPVSPAPAVPTAVEGTEHTVMKGDSFYTLARKYNVSTKAIAAANQGVDSTKLKIGQKLKIPAASPASASISPIPDSSAPGGIEKVYVVKSSDNLNKIARANSISVKALRAANNLKTDQIKVGQKLKIPSKASTTADFTPTSATGAIAATNQ